MLKRIKWVLSIIQIIMFGLKLQEQTFEAIGLPYDRIEESGIMFPLIESGCIYKEGAKYADNIIIKSCIKEIKGMKFTFYMML